MDIRLIETSEYVQNKLRNHNTIQDESIRDLYNEVKEKTIVLMSNEEGISLSQLRTVILQQFDFSKMDIDIPYNWTYDLYSQYERIGTNEVRKELGLVFAVYEGGIINDTREFCSERSYKVFHISEIEGWVNLEWEGKPETGYNPIIDLGGYNCRHRLRWVSKEFAAAKRPEVRNLFSNYF